jgi:class 3 adenylate cyclase
MSPRGPYRRHSPQFRLQLCQDIRSGAIGRRDAARRHNLSTNLLQLWLTQYDRGELSTEEAEASIIAEYEARIAALERKVGQLSTGDGIMASFDNVADSVRAAADIQRRFAAYNADASETLSVRIGIDAGEPVEDHSDLFGSTVQLAARLCSEAEANGIIVSGFARELCNEDAARFVALGERRLKGFADKAQVFRFEWRDQHADRAN